MLKKWFFLSFIGQIGVFIVISAIVFYFLGEKSSLSALLGGIAYIVPTLLANIYMHKPVMNEVPSFTVGRAYMGNIYKLIITVGIIVFVFKEIDIRANVFIVCYCIASLVNVVMSFVSINRE